MTIPEMRSEINLPDNKSGRITAAYGLVDEQIEQNRRIGLLRL